MADKPLSFRRRQLARIVTRRQRQRELANDPAVKKAIFLNNLAHGAAMVRKWEDYVSHPLASPKVKKHGEWLLSILRRTLHALSLTNEPHSEEYYALQQAIAKSNSQFAQLLRKKAPRFKQAPQPQKRWQNTQRRKGKIYTGTPLPAAKQPAQQVLAFTHRRPVQQARRNTHRTHRVRKSESDEHRRRVSFGSGSLRGAVLLGTCIGLSGQTPYTGLMLRKIALTVCLLVALLALFAPLVAPFSPTELHLGDVLRTPGPTFWLGTDTLGRDVLSRLLFGARTSLAVGLIAVGLATFLGLLIGALAALGPKWLDSLLMRTTDVALCFPTIFLILAIITILTPSLLNVMIVIGLTSWMGTARLVRSEVMSIRARPFYGAAILAGVPATRRFIRHVLPHLMPIILTTLSLGLAGAILAESALSFLGLGIQPPTPSWGAMLTDGKSVLGVAWWLMVFPGVAIIFTVLAFTLAAEAPALRKSR